MNSVRVISNPDKSGSKSASNRNIDLFHLAGNEQSSGSQELKVLSGHVHFGEEPVNVGHS